MKEKLLYYAPLLPLGWILCLYYYEQDRFYVLDEGPLEFIASVIIQLTSTITIGWILYSQCL